MIPALFSRAGLYAGAAALALLVGGVLLHQHDNSVRAVMQARQDAAVAAATADTQRRVNEALNALQAAQAARDAALAAPRRNIRAAPPTTACSGSPAIRRALDGLRPGRGPGAPTRNP